MNIIVEGPDNSGKSTVVEAIRRSIGWRVCFSGGREKYLGEINARLTGFLEYEETIFDRHPAISQEIYRHIHNGTPIHPELLKQFYNQSNLIIYCRPHLIEGLQGQVIKEYDKPEHIAQIEESFIELVQLYDAWAIERAHIVRRKYDDIQRTISLVCGAYNWVPA